MFREFALDAVQITYTIIFSSIYVIYYEFIDYFPPLTSKQYRLVICFII